LDRSRTAGFTYKWLICHERSILKNLLGLHNFVQQIDGILPLLCNQILRGRSRLYGEDRLFLPEQALVICLRCVTNFVDNTMLLIFLPEQLSGFYTRLFEPHFKRLFNHQILVELFLHDLRMF
jgi:hypothetical protein